MRAPIRLLNICSLLMLTSCATLPGLPVRPDVNAYQINVSSDGKYAEVYGFNVRDDYTADGTLKPDAKPKIIELKSLSDLRGWYATPRDGFKKTKSYTGAMTKWLREHCK